ncbi:MAG: 5'/3'-nucleotidase SurE [Nitrospiraceae bacterium]
MAAALQSLGEVWVVAPERERTAVAHAVTLHKPLRLTKLESRWFAVNGTPVDCVNLALAKVLPRTPARRLRHQPRRESRR